MILRIVMCAILALSWIAIRAYGSTLPYINVSPHIFEAASTVALALSIGTLNQYSRYIVMSISLLLALFMSITSQGAPVTAALIGILCAPALDKKKAFAFGEKIRIKGEFVYKNHFWWGLGGILSILTLIFYYPSFSSYFQGDEWVFFRLFRDAGLSKVWFIQGFIDTFAPGNVILHASPLTHMLQVIQHHLYGLNFTLYILHSVVTHVLVSLSFGWFVYELTRSKKYTLLSSILFVTAASGAEAVTWTIAALATQNALFFSFLSSVFVLKFTQSSEKKHIVYASLFLLLALLSKETAVSFIIIFVALYCLRLPRKKWNLVQDLKYFVAVTVIFGLMQLFFRSQTPLKPDMTVGQYIFHYITLSSKIFSQSILAHPIPLRLSEWVTDMQFPYFNEEKSIRGTNYLMFIQVAALEFMSHIMTFIIGILLYFLVRDKKNKSLTIIAVIFYLASTFPISLISLQFPWWRFQASVDSHHFYSILPAVILLLILALEKISNFISQKVKILPWIAMTVLVLCILGSQLELVHSYITNQQREIYLPERKVIVTSMQNEIPNPPKRMLIYTTSNKSFYGFATLILPFQTAFSQVLPVIFDTRHHPQGLHYPSSFFEQDFIGDAGIASQGYYEENGYGLGYFLNLNNVIKTIEKEKIPLEDLHSFSFNADSRSLENISESVRNELKEKLASRRVFASWKRYSNKNDLMSFQADPQWSVIREKNTYRISSNGQMIAHITIIPAPIGSNFATFVSDYEINGTRIDSNYTTEVRPVDLDLPRTILIPNDYPNTFFAVAGNNLQFYRFDIYNKELAELFFRTFEFVDEQGEKISR